MTEKGKRAAAALLALVAAMLATACTANTQSGSSGAPSQDSQSGAAQAEVADAYVNKVFPEQAEIERGNVKWGEDVDLDEGQRDSIVKYLTERFSSGTHDLATDVITVDKASNSKEGKARYAVAFEGSQERYTVTKEGDGWTLAGGAPEENDASSAPATGEEAFRQSIIASVPDGEKIDDIGAYVGDTGKTSEFNSTDAMRQFDFNNAIPLSESEKIAKLVGKDVEKRIFSDVNDYLSPGNRKIDGKINVLLDPSTVSNEGATTTFRVLTASRGDTIVLECSYERESGKHQVTWKP